MLVNNNLYSFTGGPGAGKTTLLELLKEKGFITVDETGRQIIRERLLMGLSPRPNPAEFAKQMLKRDLENYKRHYSSSSPVFFDRSFVDSAYLVLQNDKTQFHSLSKFLLANRFNSMVFIFPPWKEIYQTDNERDQTFEEAIDIYQNLLEWYTSQDYSLVEVPKIPIDERLEFVLSYILTETKGT